tara:strand:+ start:309 stop:539 length:231 start_codon:yes stop_codon:yes gene_type:complete
MFIRPRRSFEYNVDKWLAEKVNTIDGNLWYTHEEYINHFTNTLIEMAEEKGYQIKDINEFKEEIIWLIQGEADNIS